jgi:hypothetical protein
MSLNKLILNTLKPLGIPIGFHTLDSEQEKLHPTTYITFFEYNQNSALNADDMETKTKQSVQIDVWSKGDYTSLVQQIKDSLLDQGFRRTTENELYEPDTKIYHKVIRFNFVQ